jgi:hypothetical protein
MQRRAIEPARRTFEQAQAEAWLGFEILDEINGLLNGIARRALYCGVAVRKTAQCAALTGALYLSLSSKSIKLV